jgi:hypothetical protein
MGSNKKKNSDFARVNIYVKQTFWRPVKAKNRENRAWWAKFDIFLYSLKASFFYIKAIS